jgi:hypothetical protein
VLFRLPARYPGSRNQERKGGSVPHDDSTMRNKLAHVLWIGGSPDSGKTSIADFLAARHGLQVYHFDCHESDHLGRATPERQPTAVALRTLVETLDESTLAHELWLAHPPAAMAQFAISTWSERVGLAVEDLLAMPTTPPIIAEGPGFFPERIHPLLTDHRQAIWLIHTAAFKRASALRRNKPGSRHLTTNPAQAQENLILRDLAMGDHIRRAATDLGLTLHEVDGTRPLEAVAALVEAHFTPWLP